MGALRVLAAPGWRTTTFGRRFEDQFRHNWRPVFAAFKTVSAEGDELMPPLIAWGVGMLGGAALVRWAVKEAQRVSRELEEARLARMQQTMQGERIPTLRRDPVTGAYRPE